MLNHHSPQHIGHCLLGLAWGGRFDERQSALRDRAQFEAIRRTGQLRNGRRAQTKMQSDRDQRCASQREHDGLKRSSVLAEA